MRPVQADAAIPELEPPVPAPWRFPRTLVVAACVVLFGAWMILQERPLPDFQKIKSPLPRPLASLEKPIFAVPSEDEKNPILAVYFGALSDEIVEVSVVFSDEDHPIAVIDELYDFYRWNFAWKREADIESFHILFPKGQGVGSGASPSSVSFPTTFAGEQRFGEILVSHLSADVPYEEFHKRGQRPVIYVKTWNHLYSNKADGEVPNWSMQGDYRALHGTREDVERRFRR